MATIFDPFRDLNFVADALLNTRSGLQPMPMDLYREGDHYIVNAYLPGIDPGSVDIDVDGQLLTIRADRTLVSGDGVKWITREIAVSTAEAGQPEQPKVVTVDAAAAE